MSREKLGVEAKIISLFTALPEESRRIVFDILKGQMATPRKVAKKPVPKTLGRKPAGFFPDEPEDFKHEAVG